MNLLVKLSVVAVLGAACAACSHSNSSSTPAASAPAAGRAPAASAIPLQAPPPSTSADVDVVPPVNGPTLADFLRRPSFRQTYAAMDGIAALPAWAKAGGGNAAPASRVQVAGHSMWLTHACETAACRGGQLYVLIDTAAHTMQGLFIESSGSAGASVQKLTWLGKPDAATQAYLKGLANQG